MYILIAYIEIVAINTLDLIGVSNRDANIMGDHQTCELISIYKHKFYGMLHTCKLKGAFRESRRCDKETLCRARSRQSAHKCL